MVKMKPITIVNIQTKSPNQQFNCGSFRQFATSDDAHSQALLGQLERLHRFEFWVWFYCTQGTAWHMIDFQERCLTVGQAILIPPNTLHQLSMSDQADAYILAWRDEFLPRGIDIDHLPNVQIFDDDGKAEMAAFIKLFDCGKNTDNHMLKIAILQSQLAAFLHRLQVYFGMPAPPVDASHRRYLTFLALLECHLFECHQVKDYADKLACTPKTLNTTCQTHAQKSAKRLINDRILLESKRLLAHSQHSINTIGEMLGFVDGTHFGKFFRQNEGVNAGVFRMNMLESLNKNPKNLT